MISIEDNVSVIKNKEVFMIKLGNQIGHQVSNY